MGFPKYCLRRHRTSHLLRISVHVSGSARVMEFTEQKEEEEEMDMKTALGKKSCFHMTSKEPQVFLSSERASFSSWAGQCHCRTVIHLQTCTHGSHGPKESLLDTQAVPANVGHHVRRNAEQEGYQFLRVLPNKQIRGMGAWVIL